MRGVESVLARAVSSAESGIGWACLSLVDGAVEWLRLLKLAFQFAGATADQGY